MLKATLPDVRIHGFRFTCADSWISRICPLTATRTMNSCRAHEALY